MNSYLTIKLTAGVLATIGLYSVLFRENKFYRFFEHMFLGLAAGYASYALWTETLKANWWDKMVGQIAEGSNPAVGGNWLYALLLPFSIMGFFVFSRKHNWMSRLPIGLILGLWSGQQVQNWYNQYGPQIANSLVPVVPNNFSSFTQPVPGDTLSASQAARITGPLYFSEAINNIIFLVTILSVLSYFIFSVDLRGKLIGKMPMVGRWLLMIGFGAIFGSTVMMRFTLLIDRMYYVWIEWFRDTVLRMIGGG